MRAALWIVILTSVAQASPAAEKLFEDGRAALAAGHLDEACDDLRRSEALESRVGTLLNLADCEERRGRVVSAWSAFVEAHALAIQHADPRAAEADKRAGLLAGKLSYLKIAVHPVDGLVVKRDGQVVPPAELDKELPLDPATYTIEAAAPGHKPWSAQVEVKLGAHASLEVPALDRDAIPPKIDPVPEPIVVTQPARDAVPVVVTPTNSHRIGIGALAGVTSDSEWLIGMRGVFRLGPAGPGEIRAVTQVLYTRETPDPYHHIDLVAPSLAAEYVQPLSDRFLLAGGLAFGVDFSQDSYPDNPVQTNAWGALRASPTVRFGAIDLGLHLQLVRTDRFLVLGELGLDYYVW